MHLSLSILAVTLALTGPEVSGPRPLPSEARISPCFVTLIEESEVSAQEAGVLVALEAKEGMQVEAGTFLARVNDSKAQMAKLVAQAELDTAIEQATNDINVRFAIASEEVAEQELRINLEANKLHPNSKPVTEIQRLKLQHRRSELQIEQSDLELRVAKLTAKAKEAQVSAADDDIFRRQITAPISGEIQDVGPHLGEWVNPGDVVVRIVRLDRLRVEGAVHSNQFSQGEIIGRPVDVHVELARGRFETFNGKIVYVDPLVQANGEYRVYAEVENRQQEGQWLLHPGARAEMTIFTGVPADALAQPLQ